MARKILLADDSVTAQNMGRKILVDAGYDVVTVNNGSAALKRVNESKPDLVVLDVYMPGYSGLEVCQRLKETAETAHIPVLLTVGKLEPFKPDEARRARADAHIVKPFEASELLSALARLEDLMASSANEAKPRRKGAPDNGSAKADAADLDTGWKSRLRFPAQKKKEKEVAPADAGTGFHDFRPSKGKPASSVLAGFDPAVPEPEPEVAPDIPRDITPDELDALSALAARLEAPAVEPGNPEAAFASGDAKAPVETVAPALETAAAPATPPAETPQAHISPAATESVEAETPPASAPSASEAVAVNASQFAQEPAPIDREDEPIFAVAPPPAAEEAEASAVEAVAASAPDAPAEQVGASAEETGTDESTPVETTATATGIAEPTLEQSNVAELKPAAALEGESPAEPIAEQAATIEPALPAAAAVSPKEAPEAPAPSDEELTEALRLLTPATGHGETSMPSPDALVAAGHLLAEEAARTAAAEPRWVAEAVALTPEEAALSLEAEMFGTFAAEPARETAPASPLSRLTDLDPATETLASQAAPMESNSPADSASALVEESIPLQAPAATFADVAPVQEAEAACPAASATAATMPALETAAQPTIAEQALVQALALAAHATSGEAVGPGDNPETPKAMAAAAAADGASKAITDSSAIASIVDSVLADLRPKIVEEIAKKLAGK